MNYRPSHLLAILLSLMIFTFFGSQSIAQKNDSLKLNSLSNASRINSPYSNTEVKWLEKNGFKASQYNWKDLKTNLELKDAFKKRTGSTIWAGLAGINFVSGLSNDNISFGLLGLVGAESLISWTKSRRAKKFTKQAENLRLNYMLDQNVQIQGTTNSMIQASAIKTLRKSDVKWLDKNDFSAHDYDWNDKEINLYLNKSLNKKNATKATNIIGSFTLIYGLLNYYAALLTDVEGRQKDLISDGNSMFLVSGSFYLTSIILKDSSLKNLRKAKKLRARIKY